jgi:four helix bundle protein
MAQFQNLTVWKLAHELVLDIYRITKKFPADEKYRLTDQLCRAASSVPMNISEGTGRNTDKDFAYFLCIARGSLYETQYQLILAKDLGYLEEEEFADLLVKCDNIGRKLNAFIRRLRN